MGRKWTPEVSTLTVPGEKGRRGTAYPVEDTDCPVASGSAEMRVSSMFPTVKPLRRTRRKASVYKEVIHKALMMGQSTSQPVGRSPLKVPIADL